MTLMNRWSFALACLGLGVMANTSALAQTPPVAMSAVRRPEASAFLTADSMRAATSARSKV